MIRKKQELLDALKSNENATLEWHQGTGQTYYRINYGNDKGDWVSKTAANAVIKDSSVKQTVKKWNHQVYILNADKK